jgi:hypothetical protein
VRPLTRQDTQSEEVGYKKKSKTEGEMIGITAALFLSQKLLEGGTKRDRKENDRRRAW